MLSFSREWAERETAESERLLTEIVEHQPLDKVVIALKVELEPGRSRALFMGHLLILLLVEKAVCADRDLIFAQLLVDDELVKQETLHKFHIALLTSDGETLEIGDTSSVIVVDGLFS